MSKVLTSSLRKRGSGAILRYFGSSILVKTAVFSWLVTIATVAIFMWFILPFQKTTFIDNLDSQALLVVSSIRELASGAIVSEDYSEVVDQCMDIVTSNESIHYLVLTRRDGFSLVHNRDGWTMADLGEWWRPAGAREVNAFIGPSELSKEAVYHSAHPFDYSGLEWGWLHLGLSLEKYHQDVWSVYRYTGLVGIICIAVSLFASLVYARRLTRPILTLRNAVQKVSEGDFTTRAVLSSRDEVQSLAQSFNDMTDSLQSARANLEEAHEYTSNILQSMNDMLIVASSDRKIVTCNPAVCRRLEYSEEELVGRRLDEIVLSDTHIERMRTETYLEQDVLRDEERIYITKSGAQIPVMFSSAVMRDENDAHQGQVCVAVDITERKRAEASRRKHEENLKQLNEKLSELARNQDLHSGNFEAATRILTKSAREALWADRVSIWLNDSTDELLKCVDLCAGDPPSHSSGECLVRGDHPAYFEALRKERCIAAEDAMHDSRTASFAKGYLRPHDIRSMLDAPIRRAGEQVGVLCIEQTGSIRHWDLEIQNFAGSLADLTSLALEARDRKVREESLEQAKDDAEAANRAKSTFLANMSHEIRTPLNGVVGMLKLLQKSSLSDKQMRHADMAITSADTLLSLINDVLDFSKIEADKMELEIVDFSVQSVVEGIIGMFADKASLKGLAVGSLVHPAVPSSLRGDPNRLRQVLINLVGNAIKFTESGKVVVGGDIVEETSTQVRICFEVKDTGAGMTEEQCRAIFESFTQGDASTTRTHGGTGLGLAISKQLVGLMGGTIGVESEPGAGSTFWFDVLLERHGEAASRPIAHTNLRGLRVLLVDERGAHREIMHQQLTAWGCEVSEARDGKSAEIILRQALDEDRPFRVAVVSSSLPDAAASSFARDLRAERRMSELGLILISNFENLDPLCGADPEFLASLVKPVPQSILYDSIMIAVNGKRRGKSSKSRFVRDPTQVVDPAAVRILLAEDNEINQEVALEILQSAGYSCDCVASGRDAVDSVFERHYDLVLMDCQMPLMDGFDATRTIRSRETQEGRSGIPRAPIPIVALTANAMKGDRERCLEAGMDDYMSKPLDPDQLTDMVRKWLHFIDEPRGSAPSGIGDTEADRDEQADVPVLDYDRLLERCMGNEDLAVRLLAKFRDQSHAELQSVVRAYEQGDLESVARSAHKLKGSTANLSAERVQASAGSLCTLCRENPDGPIADEIARLEAELDALWQIGSAAHGVTHDGE